MASYLRAMATRLILALLAFLTGLSVQDAPARAMSRVEGSAQVGIMLGQRAVRGQAPHSTAIPAFAVASADRVADAVSAPVAIVPDIGQPPFYAGIDRARE